MSKACAIVPYFQQFGDLRPIRFTIEGADGILAATQVCEASVPSLACEPATRSMQDLAAVQVPDGMGECLRAVRVSKHANPHDYLAAVQGLRQSSRD